MFVQLLNELRNAIFDAGQLEVELEEMKAEFAETCPSRKRQLEQERTVYTGRVRIVGPFVFDTIKKLTTRCGELMEQIDNFEDILLDQDEPEQAPEMKDFLELVKTVDRISVQIEEQTEEIQKEVSCLYHLWCPYLCPDGSKEASFSG